MSNPGEVQLTLGDETFTLKCTLDAFRSIPATLGGFVGVFNNLASGDVEGVAYIIAAATGKGNNAKERERIAAKMFSVGLTSELYTTVTDYVNLLQNGGKPYREAQGETSSGE
jgi:hypothetical protein